MLAPTPLPGGAPPPPVLRATDDDEEAVPLAKDTAAGSSHEKRCRMRATRQARIGADATAIGFVNLRSTEIEVAV